MGNSRINYTTRKPPKKPNFEPKQTETTPPMNLELQRAKWVPGNSAIQGLWGLWRGNGIGGGWWWLWWCGVELRRFDEREGLREGLRRVEERRWGWLWLWALNNFLVRWYLYHCWGRGALVPLVLVLLWVLLTFLFLILHFFFFFSDCCRETQRVVVFIRLGLGLSMGMISILTEIQFITFGLDFICCSTF